MTKRMYEGSNDKNWWNKWRIKSNFVPLFPRFSFSPCYSFGAWVYFVVPIPRVNNFRSISFSAKVFRSHLTRRICQVHYVNLMHVTQAVTASIMAFWSKVIHVTSTFSPIINFMWQYSTLWWKWDICYLLPFVIQHICLAPDKSLVHKRHRFFVVQFQHHSFVISQ